MSENFGLKIGLEGEKEFKSLDADIERQLEETQVVAELVKAAVKENATAAQSQESYYKKYEALTKRYEAAAAELERLQNLRTLRSQKDKSMALYIRTLKAIPHNYRLTPFPHACLHLFRHIAQISLDRRQPACAQFVQSDEKSDGAIARK